ncbi:MAG: hypothetical protein INR66_06705 [Gordonia polyisoprenivorans]|nr:hypothetical protein [Gordonia polyisoprenivorans]
MISTGIRLVIPAWLHDLWSRVWSSRWGRRTVIAVMVWHLAGAIGLATAPLAAADPDSGSSTPPDGALTQLMGWMNLKDSHGINTADYYLSIPDDSKVHMIRTMFAWLTILEYSAYRILVMTAIWIIHQVLTFKWLQVIVSPVADLGDALSVLTGRVNLVPMAFAFAGLAIALWIFRGRYAAAAYEGLMALVIAAAAVGFLAHPISTIAGTDGLIVKTKDAALQVSSGLVNKGNTDTDPGTNVNHLTTALTDTFLRKPTQLINFGVVLDNRPDNGACASAFDKAYLHPPGKSTTSKLLDGAKDLANDVSPIGGAVADTILPSDDPTAVVRNEVGKCPGGGPLKDYAGSPGVQSTATAGSLIPAAALIFLFGLVLAGHVLLAAAWALFNALKLIPVTPAAVAPMFRGTLFRSLADAAMALCQMAFAVIYIGAYGSLIDIVFSRNDVIFQRTVLTIDAALIIALLVFWKGMSQIRKMSDRLAEIMSRRPGVGPVAVTRRTPHSAADVMARANAARTAARAGASAAHSGGSGVKKVGTAAVKASKIAATAAATGGTSAVGAATKELGRAGAAAAMAKATTATVATAKGAIGMPATASDTYRIDTAEPVSTMQKATEARILRQALDAAAGSAVGGQKSSIRPGGGTAPTARRHTPVPTPTPTTSTAPTKSTSAQATFDRLHRIERQAQLSSPRTADTPPTPRATPIAPRSPAPRNGLISAADSGSAPTVADRPPRATPRADRAAAVPVPASVGSTTGTTRTR